MTLKNCVALATVASLLAACGGGGGGTGPGSNNGGNTAAAPIEDPVQPGTTNTYQTITATTGTSPLTGAILSAGDSVTATTGTITHTSDSFTASGVAGSVSLDDGSDFDLPAYRFAKDIALESGAVAIVGVATETEDVRSTGTAAFTGDFAAQLVDSSLGPVATTLNWDVDIQVNFASNGDVDLTFEGGGSDLIDTIRISNATIDGSTFSGGTLQTLNDGATRNIAGTDVALEGAFFGYDNSLQLPGEAGGAVQASDADTVISGVFIAQAAP
ncbi:MAG: hypothetical protein AAFQ64_06055 [Pseudomonadota bacterium]